MSLTLESFTPFNTLPQDSLQSLLQITTTKTFVSKEIILYEGDISQNLYFLLNGSVKLYKVGRFENEVFLGILEQGLLLDFAPNANTFASFCNLECICDSLVACFDGAKLQELLSLDSNILTLFF